MPIIPEIKSPDCLTACFGCAIRLAVFLKYNEIVASNVIVRAVPKDIAKTANKPSTT